MTMVGMVKMAAHTRRIHQTRSWKRAWGNQRVRTPPLMQVRPTPNTYRFSLLLLHAFHIIAFLLHLCVVPKVVDDSQYGAHAGLVTIEADAGFVGGERHRGALDARQLHQVVLNLGDTRGTGHASHRQADLVHGGASTALATSGACGQQLGWVAPCSDGLAWQVEREKEKEGVSRGCPCVLALHARTNGFSSNDGRVMLHICSLRQ